MRAGVPKCDEVRFCRGNEDSDAGRVFHVVMRKDSRGNDFDAGRVFRVVMRKNLRGTDFDAGRVSRGTEFYCTKEKLPRASGTYNIACAN